MKTITRISATISFILLLCCISISCAGHAEGCASDGDTIAMRYAQNICMVKYDGYTKVTLANPWKEGETLHTYLLVPRDADVPDHLPEGTVIRVPLQRAVVYTSVHCGLLNELDAVNCIGGVCDLQYIHTPAIQQGCQNGTIIDMGEGMNPNVERIIDLDADALVLSPFENSGGYGQVEQTGVPIVECADYMEQSPLARAEWMRFYGMLFDREDKADSVFANVEAEYNSLKNKAATATSSPRLLTDLMYGSTWYVPGGNSHSGRLYVDAHSDFINATNEQSGSVPMSFETVFDMAEDADVWLIKYNQTTDMTYAQLQTDYAPYAAFKAFKQRHIYGCNTHTSNFYELANFHPETVLRDLIVILHPELMPGQQPHYYLPLQ